MAKNKVKRYSAGNYVTSEDSNSGMEEAYNDAQAESRGAEILKGMRDEAAKPKIVTKEELAKSGMSLRDYMNKQQGLTRRGESTKSDTAAIIARGQANNDADRKATEAAEAAEAASAPTTSAPARVIAAPAAKSLKDKVTREAINSIKSSGRKYPDMSALQAPAKRAGMTAMGRKSDSRFDLNSDVGYKKGGSVSSASRRADGIAQRGKTRGKMC